MSSPELPLTRTLWSALGGDDALLEALHFSGPSGGLPSRFHVSDLAAATIGVAALAAAELWAARREEPLRNVTVAGGSSRPRSRRGRWALRPVR